VLPPAPEPKLNELGKEDVSHITREAIERCLMQGNEGVIALVKAIHFNPSKPENHNLRLKTRNYFLKHGLVEAYEGKAWSLKTKAYVLDKVWKASLRPLRTLYAAWKRDGIVQALLASKAASKAKAKALVSFMDMCEALNNGLTYKDNKGHELTRVPKSMLKPIEELLLDQHAAMKGRDAPSTLDQF
jgi:hypothetical protein